MTNPGRPRVSDRLTLNGVLFVMETGTRWNYVPNRLGFGSRATCWRRLHDWQMAGVWDRLHELLLDELREVGQMTFHTLPSIPRRGGHWGGRKTGPNPRIVRDRAPSTTSS
jgi:transposase